MTTGRVFAQLLSLGAELAPDCLHARTPPNKAANEGREAARGRQKVAGGVGEGGSNRGGTSKRWGGGGQGQGCARWRTGIHQPPGSRPTEKISRWREAGRTSPAVFRRMKKLLPHLLSAGSRGYSQVDFGQKVTQKQRSALAGFVAPGRGARGGTNQQGGQRRWRRARGPAAGRCSGSSANSFQQAPGGGKSAAAPPRDKGFQFYRRQGTQGEPPARRNESRRAGANQANPSLTVDPRRLDGTGEKPRPHHFRRPAGHMASSNTCGG